MVFDPRNPIFARPMPYDPANPTTAFPLDEPVTFQGGPRPIPGAVAPVSPVAKPKGVFDRFVNRLAPFASDFGEPQETLPYRPTAVTVLRDAAKGFLTGLSKGTERKEIREDREARRKQEEARTELEKQRVGLEQQRVDAEKEKLDKVVRGQAFDFVQKNPQIAQLANAAGVNPVSLYSDYVNGKLSPEMEGILSSGLGLAAQDAQLPEDLRQIVAYEEAKLGPEATPEQRAKVRQKALNEAVGSMADPKKRMAMAARKEQLGMELIEAQIADLRAEAGERGDANLRALAGLTNEVFQSTQSSVIRYASLLYGSQDAGAAAIGQLLSLDPNDRTNAIAGLPDPTVGGKPAPEVKKLFNEAIQRLDDLDKAQETSMQALASKVGVQLPARTRGETGGDEGGAAQPSGIPSAFRSPAEDRAEAERTKFPDPKHTHVDVTAANLRKGLEGDEKMLKSYLDRITLTHPQTGAPIEGLQTAGKLVFVKGIAKQYGEEAAINYLLRLGVDPEKLQAEFGTLSPEVLETMLKPKAPTKESGAPQLDIRR